MSDPGNPKPDLATQAQDVLNRNDRGHYTMPARDLYPHQWLWDSCFIAIGQRHYDVERAKMEILSLLRGQWSNGMLPHVIFSEKREFHQDRQLWRSWVSPLAPDGVATSGITQPPMLAEAIVRIGEKLPLADRRSWYRQVYHPLLNYHLWLYADRDPHNEGLTLQIHPWETGLDNTPPWMSELHEHLLPWWIRILQRTNLDTVVGLFRRDNVRGWHETRYSTIDALAMYDAQRRLRRKAYNIDKVLDHSLFTIEDLSFNCMLIRANEHLQEIARSLRKELPGSLSKSIEASKKSLDELWDPYTETYYSRDFITHKLIKEPNIGALLPLYAGCITPERAALLVKSLENEHMFGPAYPIPSVPLTSTWFNATRYWQGPTWMNMNWLIIDGLRRYGYRHHADALVESSLELIGKHGFYEYFDPLSGEALGATDFSWTAALALDWLKRTPKK
jgi:hypothetical protein